MTTQLSQYQNGNCLVTIMYDGSKTREWDGIASPEFPESIDIKITDYCDAGCGYCHEKSTRKGLHGNTKSVLSILDGLPAGVELAIGGGNPLSHPDLVPILMELKSRGLIANLTVNAIHLEDYSMRIDSMRKDKLIRGLGISYHPDYIRTIENMIDENTVVHVIAGVHNPQEIRRFLQTTNTIPRKILVLGYKQFGFGLKFYNPKVEALLRAWKYWITAFLQYKNVSISFDNLGLKQLGIESVTPKDIWNQRFMGEDGTFTMYIDAVRNEFSRTSTGIRASIGFKNIREIFSEVRTIPGKF